MVRRKEDKVNRIATDLILLKKEKILAASDPVLIKNLEIEIFDSLPSTNDYLLNTANEKKTHPSVCLAETQTHGKGRQGRNWFSPFAKNIYLSILWHFQKEISELSGLSLAVSIAVVDALKQYGIKQALGLKWPNDLLCNNQKIAGILIELLGETHTPCSAVIGIGLNIDMSETNCENITQDWTDVQSLTQKKVNRNELVGILLNELIKTFTHFQNHGLSVFIDKWNSLDLIKGKRVSVLTPTKHTHGMGQGINEFGHFLLEDEHGFIHSFSSGEVSVRLSN